MTSHRQRYEERERQLLSPQACLSSASSGRPRSEPPDPVRTGLPAGPRPDPALQVLPAPGPQDPGLPRPTGDHYRTRITHTLEVSQIARTITRALQLNEDLTEAIALGHDLGHTPFGHTGEAVLNRLLPGGFHHVRQSLRVVDLLERDGRGLNLSHEVREGIERHSKGKGAILADDEQHAASTLEAQIVRVADIIAYLNHDLDDAIRARLLTEDDVPEEIQRVVGRTHSERITAMIDDVLHATDLARRRLIRTSDEGNARADDAARVPLRAGLRQPRRCTTT